jgi:hypothetical protein
MSLAKIQKAIVKIAAFKIRVPEKKPEQTPTPVPAIAPTNVPP